MSISALFILEDVKISKNFERELLFFVPFHIFVVLHPPNLPVVDLEVYDNSFMMYNGDEKQLEELAEIYRDIYL